ncbi:MAG: recombinase family protein [Ruminococcus sp.]|nr:recombinase family protein [Ruminococcus sp.]
MPKKLNIAGYCRISVDEELDRDNTSIENQKSIIQDYTCRHFPGAKLDLYEDRDRSGYTFEQREGYMALRPKLMNGSYDILIVKDFSRFSRRNSKGLVELEDLRDAGLRIISIGDAIDYPTHDDWTAIQFRFLINEMPVTDASKKVKSVIRRRQEEGRWICAVPYGYVMTNSKTMAFTVSEPEAAIVREIFRLYNDGWGYKKIARHLSELHIPTPRMTEKARKEAAGEECRINAKEEWSIVTVGEILTNDFYIGTLRQGKYRRRKINGSDEKLEQTEHLVFENNHEPIVEPTVFARAQENIKQRSKTGYRGIRKYENAYSGHLFCGDCGAPMFSMSRADLAPAYRCGTYHRMGAKACSSHHTRCDLLDSLIKNYLIKVRDNSQEILAELQEAIDREQAETAQSRSGVESFEQLIEAARSEIKMLTRQRALDLTRHPERAEMLDEIYDEQLDELTLRIEGLKNQQKLAADRHNAFIRANRTAKTVFEVFNSIIERDSLTKSDIDLTVDKIVIFTDRIEIHLRADIDSLLRLAEKRDAVPACVPLEDAANFTQGTESPENTPSSALSKSETFSVNIVSKGDPLEIYTSSDGEVVFRKFSPVGELDGGTAQAAEVIAKLTGHAALVFDRDHVVAVSGARRSEYAERRLSPALEDLIEQRRSYAFDRDDTPRLFPIEGLDKPALAAVPIISAGDAIGAVALIEPSGEPKADEKNLMLARAAAMFLGKQIEN